MAGFDIITPQTRQVLDGNAADLPVPYGLHHALESGAFKVCPGKAVVDVNLCFLQFAEAGKVIADDLNLAFDRDTPIFRRILVREPGIDGRWDRQAAGGGL